MLIIWDIINIQSYEQKFAFLNFYQDISYFGYVLDSQTANDAMPGEATEDVIHRYVS